MRDTKELVEENNRKRELLTKENEKVYSDFMLYIRTDFSISEQEGEEVLMDILDHLLLAQEEGRTAGDLFGDDPRAYADELIELLPAPTKRSVVAFTISQLFNFAAWFALSSGVFVGIFSLFMEYEYTIRVGTTGVIVLIILFTFIFGIKIIFGLIRSSLFLKKQDKSIYWKVGLFGAGAMGLLLLCFWLLPEFGPEVTLQWYMYLGIGAFMILVSKLIGRAG